MKWACSIASCSARSLEGHELGKRGRSHGWLLQSEVSEEPGGSRGRAWLLEGRSSIPSGGKLPTGSKLRPPRCSTSHLHRGWRIVWGHVLEFPERCTGNVLAREVDYLTLLPCFRERNHNPHDGDVLSSREPRTHDGSLTLSLAGAALLVPDTTNEPEFRLLGTFIPAREVLRYLFFWIILETMRKSVHTVVPRSWMGGRGSRERSYGARAWMINYRVTGGNTYRVTGGNTLTGGNTYRVTGGNTYQQRSLRWVSFKISRMKEGGA